MYWNKFWLKQSKYGMKWRMTYDQTDKYRCLKLTILTTGRTWIHSFYRSIYVNDFLFLVFFNTFGVFACYFKLLFMSFHVEMNSEWRRTHLTRSLTWFQSISFDDFPVCCFAICLCICKYVSVGGGCVKIGLL